MKNNNLSLTYNCWGKSISMKKNINILTPNTVFDMFKKIMIAEFGEEDFNKMLEHEYQQYRETKPLLTRERLSINL